MPENRIPKSKNEKASSTILTKCWKYGRHCCCRFGLYPLVVAPVLTVACLLSLYSSSGCKFVTVRIGFDQKPNVAWNGSSASLGFWYDNLPGQNEHDDNYESGNPFDLEFVHSLHEGCRWYTNFFEERYIQTDRTWKVARIMAMISGCGSVACALLAWAFVGPFFCPLGIFWHGILLPLVMISLVAEGSKFLIFDMGICKNSIFYEQDNQDGSPPKSAESCQIGESAIPGIAAAGLLLVSFVLVAINIPRARNLDPLFGIPENGTNSSDDDDENVRECPVRPLPSTNSAKGSNQNIFNKHHHNQEKELLNDKQYLLEVHDLERPSDDSSEYADVVREHELGAFECRRQGSSSISFISKPESFGSLFKRDQDSTMGPFSVASSMDSSLASSLGASSVGKNSRNFSLNELLDEKEGDESLDSTLVSSVVTGLEHVRISESRLSTLASLEQKAVGACDISTTSSMLKDLVRDLDSTYSQPRESPLSVSSRYSTVPDQFYQREI